LNFQFSADNSNYKDARSKLIGHSGEHIPVLGNADTAGGHPKSQPYTARVSISYPFQLFKQAKCNGIEVSYNPACIALSKAFPGAHTEDECRLIGKDEPERIKLPEREELFSVDESVATIK
jgi:hypothetical protein